MRDAFITSLDALAEADDSVMLLVGDLGFGVIEEFAGRHPRQFLNAGVAEQAMTGVAAGLALAGRRVFTYSIANFPTLRCLEQLRNDVCHHRLDVTVVAVGGGLAYGTLGYSHWAIEDLAVLRALPHLTVIAPGDPVEAAAATTALGQRSGPAYLRLGKNNSPTCHAAVVDFRIGRALSVRAGTDVTIITTGDVLPEAIDAAGRLQDGCGISAAVLSMHTVRPLDIVAVAEAAARGPVVTVEEHILRGGLGGAVAETFLDAGIVAPLLRVGLPDEVSNAYPADQCYLRRTYGLAAAPLAARIERWLTTRAAKPQRPLADETATTTQATAAMWARCRSR